MNPPPSAKPGRHCGCQPRVAEILIRHASLADAPRLAAIDAESSPSPWSEQAVRDSLAHALAFVAADPGGTVTGFVLCSAVLDTCEILLIAVAPSARRRGIARRLLAQALAAATEAGAERCFLDVRESNAAAIGLYRALGFHVDGRRKAYYRSADGREDAVLMSRALSR